MKQYSPKTMFFRMADGDSQSYYDASDSEEYYDAFDEAKEIEKEEEEKKRQKVKKSIEKVKKSLQAGEPKTVAQKIAKAKYKQGPIGAAALSADMYEPEEMDDENEASFQVPMVVENKEPPKTKLERKEKKRLIKEMLKESQAEATKPKRKKHSVKPTRLKTIKETRTQLVKELRPSKEPKKGKEISRKRKGYVR